MTISGIRPISGRLSNFGAYDVSKLHKPVAESVTSVSKVKPLQSLAQVKKAVDVMKRDAVLHKYQKFVGDKEKVLESNRGVMENFTL